MARVLVSACLLGEACRYDGRSKRDDAVLGYLADHQAVPVCPERDGGLGVPRPTSHLTGGDGFSVLEGEARVLDLGGADVTECFLTGAAAALAAAREHGVRCAILKERSPSCGLRSAEVDRGEREGVGVAAALLIGEGIEVYSEEDVAAGRMPKVE